MSVQTLEASEKPLVDIFCDKYEFRIPSYQRPYAWTIDQVSELLDDVSTAAAGSGDISELAPYFLGSIVLIKNPQKPMAEVVDGQQRLTTLTILFSVLRDLDQDGLSNSIHGYVGQQGDEIKGTSDILRLTPRERDADFFRKNIQQPKATTSLPSTVGLSDSRTRMIENARYLASKLSERSPEARKRLIMFLVRRCYLVVVAASDQTSAFRIFSVLNSRGLDLSPADILKADIIGAIPASSQDKYTKVWEDLEDELGRAKFADLFGHIRMIHAKQKPRKTLVEEFREFVPALKNPIAFVDDQLLPFAEAYDEVNRKSFTSPTLADAVNRQLTYLSRLDNVDWEPLAILMIAKLRQDPSALLKFLVDLERLAYSLFLLRTDPTDRIARYAKVLVHIEKGDDLYVGSSPLQLTDEEKKKTRAALEGDIYLTTRLRVPLLLRLDEVLSKGNASYAHSIITVEHVLPQNPASNSVWIKNFPNPADRDVWTHKLANLVLLTRRKNSSASNYDFDQKKSIYFTPKNGVANFAITSTVLAESDWTPNTLAKRQKTFIDTLSQEWRLT